MQVSRMDLDGAGSPMALVTKILTCEPNLPIPVPIEDLARQLDIVEIRDVAAGGFEGGLITDAARSDGFILVNSAAHLVRKRFTIGHELGHFLMTHHKPPPDGFQCTREDMRRWAGKDKGGALKFEVEANEFSSLILMPPPAWRKSMAGLRDPDLSQIVRMAGDFAVSKEAAARSYAQYHEEKVAIVVVKDGIVNKVYRKATGFPSMCLGNGSPVPRQSLFFTGKPPIGQPSAVVEARPEFWLETVWGKRMPDLYEQVLVQQGGYALIMLWAEQKDEDDEFDPDENRTSKQRFQDRQARWRGEY